MEKEGGAEESLVKGKGREGREVNQEEWEGEVSQPSNKESKDVEGKGEVGKGEVGKEEVGKGEVGKEEERQIGRRDRKRGKLLMSEYVGQQMYKTKHK